MVGGGQGQEVTDAVVASRTATAVAELEHLCPGREATVVVHDPEARVERAEVVGLQHPGVRHVGPDLVERPLEDPFAFDERH